jgi:transcriptional regulator with XRE-family HTH domain
LKSSSNKGSRELGNFLAQARQKKNLTQKEVSETLRFESGQYISNVERGRCPLPRKTLVKLVKIYELDPYKVGKFLVEIEKKKIEDEFLKFF